MPKKQKLKIIYYSVLFGCGILFSFHPAYSTPSNEVQMIQLDDYTINPVTAEYINQAIDNAQKDNAQCLIIKLDTPGGLLSSTRSIVKHMLVSKVPIVVYIAPSGSRAGSAGVFITYASHIAAMAPSTNIGAAHPVEFGGSAPPKKSGDMQELRELVEELKKGKQPAATPTKETIKSESQATKETKKEEVKQEEKKEEEAANDDDPMSSKILNDTVAFIKAIAQKRGRNVEWAEEAVAKSKSIPEQEALAKKVVEIIAKDDQDLLAQLDGRVVELSDNQKVTLATKGATIKYIPMDPRKKFFNVLADPNVAYFLLILGFYGLLYEITHPGFGAPGIIGLTFLILAFYSMQTLPTNYAGLALIIFGLILFVAEVFTHSFALFTIGGITCLILGSMLLFQSVDPVMRVSLMVIISFSMTTAAITIFLLTRVIQSRRAKVHGGKEGLTGATGQARSTFAKGEKGKVFVHGELWNAVTDDTIKKGDEVDIAHVNGLTLKVKRKTIKEA